MKIAIANFSRPTHKPVDIDHWRRYEPPPRPAARRKLFDQTHDWGFHITALGVRLLDAGLADSVELWIDAETRSVRYDSAGVLWMSFVNTTDACAYIDRHGAPDLFINYGREGAPLLARLQKHSFCVHVACLRSGVAAIDCPPAECYLVDDRRFVDERSMLYIPVVNTNVVRPDGSPKVRDFVYLAGLYQGKRHDLLLRAVRDTSISGHLHPVDPSLVDLSRTAVTASGWNERDVVELLRTSRIGVYAGDYTSNPAAMWECVAAGLPLVVNREIRGGQHVIVPGVTGEFASADRFRKAIVSMLDRRESYTPREYFVEHWDTGRLLDQYLQFFQSHGWRGLN